MKALIKSLEHIGSLGEAYYGHIPSPPKSPEDKADDEVFHRLGWYLSRASPVRHADVMEVHLRGPSMNPQRAVDRWFKEQGFKNPKDYKSSLRKKAEALEKLLLTIATYIHGAKRLRKHTTVTQLDSLMWKNDYDLDAPELFKAWFERHRPERGNRIMRAIERQHYRKTVMPWIMKEFSFRR